MASTEPALDVYTLFPLPVPAPSSTAAVFEAVRRLSPAEMPNVPQLAKTPEDAAAAVSRLESTAGATGYITSGLCQYDLRSAYFSPQKALYNPHAIPPYPNVAPLDNISKFRGSLHPADKNCDMLAVARTTRGKVQLKDGTFVERGCNHAAREHSAMRNINKVARMAQAGQRS